MNKKRRKRNQGINSGVLKKVDGKGKLQYQMHCVICGKVFCNSIFLMYGNRKCPKCKHKRLHPEIISKPGLLSLRFKILARDGFRCVYCGRGKEDGTKLEVDHIIPKIAGGENKPENLITSCWECNHGKHISLLEEWQIKKAKGGKDLEDL